MPEPIFSLERVNVARGERTVLTDINLSLAAGEHLAILGPNGCGKSTLLKTITCELYPLAVNRMALAPSFASSAGSDGILPSCASVSVSSQQTSPASLPSPPPASTPSSPASSASSTLWPNLTVTHPCASAPSSSCTQVGAEHLRSHPVGEMSAGQQRRIMIARALAGSRAAAQASAQPSSPERASSRLRRNASPRRTLERPRPRRPTGPSQLLRAPGAIRQSPSCSSPITPPTSSLRSAACCS